MTNRAQRRSQASIKGQSKDQLLARAQAAEATANMFRGLHEDQIRKDERTVMEAERLVQQAQAEQRATERTIEIILFDGYVVAPLLISQEVIDAFNEADEQGEHFVNVEQTDDGFEMNLVFEPYEVEDFETEDEDVEEPTTHTGDGDADDDNGVDEDVEDGDADEAE